MRLKLSILICGILLISGCTPPLLQCFLKFPDYEETYAFDWSKDELKAQIVEAYTYGRSLLLKNLGLTLIQNEEVNSEYRQSIDIWLDKKNWGEFKSDIRNNTADTLNLIIGKHCSRKEIKLTAIIKGDDKNSTLTIKDVEYQRRRACDNTKEYHKVKISDKIKKKLINNLK